MEVINARNNLSESVLEDIQDFLCSSGIIFYPTETLYGIGCHGLDEVAVANLIDIKGRDSTKGLSLLIADASDIGEYTKSVPQNCLTLLEHFWPGPLTLIFEGSKYIPRQLLSDEMSIAMRVSPHPLAAKIVQMIDGPLTATSANLSGQPAAISPSEIQEQFGCLADVKLLDSGSLPKSKGSTVLDVRTNPWRLVREGEISRLILQNFGEVING